MRVGKAAVLFGWMLLATILASAAPADDVEERLKSDYLGKTLTLRHFYRGNQLLFQPDGSVIGFADIGPWTVDGEIVVETIGLHEGRLQIHARRVCLTFDSKAKTSRDVLELLEESSSPDKEALEGVFRANEVDIAIGLAGEKSDWASVSAAMNTVFLTLGESMRDFAPDFWQDYLDGVEGRPRTIRHSADAVYFVKPGVVTAPHVLRQDDPEFSQEARQAKYQGTMIVSLIVDPSGAVSNLAIISPLGMGLDEKAIAAVGTWKFEPGVKDGKPVPVQLMVEVDFHLY